MDTPCACVRLRSITANCCENFTLGCSRKLRGPTFQLPLGNPKCHEKVDQRAFSSLPLTVFAVPPLGTVTKLRVQTKDSAPVGSTYDIGQITLRTHYHKLIDALATHSSTTQYRSPELSIK